LLHPKPTFSLARTLILCVGNILFWNDGFGPDVADQLSRTFLLPDDVVVLDVGSEARKVLFTATLSELRPKKVIVVDAADWGQEIGSVHEIPV
jgi:coenzyme F420 hydrogenase subunit delta